MKAFIVIATLLAVAFTALSATRNVHASAGDNTQVQYCYYYKHKAMITGDPYWWDVYRKCLKF